MTLSTDIFINQPVDHRAVHAKVNEILGIVNPIVSDEPEFDHWEWDDPENRKAGTGTRVYKPEPCTHLLENDPDQGFPAWVMVHYRPDGPVVGPGPCHDSDCQLPGNEADWTYPEEGACTYRRHFPHCVHVDLDTAYGYKDDLGRGCSELHVDVIMKLGIWLDEQSVTDWEWTNEYSGVTYKRFDGLETMIESGAKAMTWFQGEAMPAIERHMALTEVASMSDDEMQARATEMGYELDPEQPAEFRQRAQDILDKLS